MTATEPLHGRSLIDLASDLRDGSTTALTLIEASIARADEVDGLLGVYLARFDDQAREAAVRADMELGAGRDRGPLHGIPVGIKDIIATAEGPTTAQSLVLPTDWAEPGFDAPVVERLRQAGAVVTGKTTTMEFAIGYPDQDKPFPLPRNPWNTETWTGGSSSGTAGGIASGVFPTGLGSDTAGSIRLPASYCGVTGFKQSFGLVPKNGVVPLGFTYDHVGPLARSVADCAAVLDVLIGADVRDTSTVDAGRQGLLSACDRGADDLRIGVARSVTTDGPHCDPRIAAAFDDSLGVLEDLGATVVDVELPHWKALHDACFLGLFAEAFAWHRPHLAEKWEDYGRGTRMSIALGGLLSGADHVQLERVRRVGRRDIARLLTDVDVIVHPTTGTTAPPFRGGPDRETRLGSLFTPPWNSLGFPSLAVPMGFVEDLPASLLISGRPLDDATVAAVGAAFQSVTDWHRRTPPPLEPQIPSVG
ncbi:MAG: amidase [Actinomycetia bacterium]|nr:amidase [Actinomycetes bacterium]